MDWIQLTASSQLAELKAHSKIKPQLIFKHSTRCSISGMAKSRLERGVAPGNIDFHVLDLVRHREVSNKVAEDFLVGHESPQVLLIIDGECIYDESHSGINMKDIEDKAAIS